MNFELRWLRKLDSDVAILEYRTMEVQHWGESMGDVEVWSDWKEVPLVEIEGE